MPGRKTDGIARVQSRTESTYSVNEDGTLYIFKDSTRNTRGHWLDWMDALSKNAGSDAVDPNGQDITIPLIAEFGCEGCKKSRSDLGLPYFRVCKRCKIAYYCSPECQRKAWTEYGHKDMCRKKGEFKPGDFACILESRGDMRIGEEVCIVESAPIPLKGGAGNTANQDWTRQCWLVKANQDETKTGVVPVKLLRRIHPTCWPA